MDHHVGDDEIAQVEQAAEHVAVVLLDAAFMVEEIDRTAQFLMCGKKGLVGADAKPEQAKNPAHHRLDADQHRSEQPHYP